MFLGIDCGTQGTKALLIEDDGNVKGRGHAPHQLVERETGAREQHPQWWIDALIASVRQAILQAGSPSVQAIGVSGQQHGLVVLDQAMQVIRPAKLWNDTETAPQNDSLVARYGGTAAWSQRFGIVPLTGYTLSKLQWIKDAEPENFARIQHILLPHEYLNYWLTGNIAAEFGDASGTAFFDVRSRTWIREILDDIDGGEGRLYAALPPLLSPQDIVGKLRTEAAIALGISGDCVISVGGGDNMMGAIGTGNVREGVVTMSLGTSSTVYSYSDVPVLDPQGRVAPFCSSSGGWLPLVCTMNATNVVGRTLELLGQTVEAIDAALAATTPGSEGMTFIPYLNGERTPDLPQAKGTLLGLSANNFTSANLLRATVEGVTFGMLAGLRLILNGRKAEQIVLIGGGARSAGWRQMLADATGSIIQVPLQDEAGCLGAAIQAISAYQRFRGAPASIVAIAERCVTMDAARSAIPSPSCKVAYSGAFSLYQNRVKEIYGVDV